MKHADVRAWMLTAAPGELRFPPPAVGVHVAGCRGCAVALADLTRGLDLLAAGRDAATPRMSGDEAVGLAVAGARGDVAPARPAASPPARPRPGGRRRRTLVPAAVLAAAAVALLWPDAASPPPPPVQLAEERGGPAFAVRVAADARVAVFATTNPRIHVVWMIDGRNRNERGR